MRRDKQTEPLKQEAYYALDELFPRPQSVDDTVSLVDMGHGVPMSVCMDCERAFPDFCSFHQSQWDEHPAWRRQGMVE